jgi:diaminopimelate epimerase
MKFTKMHGTGNDYVYIDCFSEAGPKDPSTAAIRISDRHFGVGSDGLILIKPGPNDTDAEMEMYNADGSKAEMCGNGLRCVAKFLYDRGIAKKERLAILTGKGILGAEIVETKEGRATKIRLNMGAPILSGRKIPTVFNANPVLNQAIEIDGRTFLCTCVSMGNPHCVIYVDDVASFPVTTIGPLIENASMFPKRINVEFVQILSGGEVIQRTWERGAGETLACGTGASAVCTAGVLLGLTDRNLRIHLLGGDLDLQYREDETVFLTGPAEEVFVGEIEL